MVYKLQEYDGAPAASAPRARPPGRARKQVWRLSDADGWILRDEIALTARSARPGAVAGGGDARRPPAATRLTLAESRARAATQLGRLPPSLAGLSAGSRTRWTSAKRSARWPTQSTARSAAPERRAERARATRRGRLHISAPGICGWPAPGGCGLFATMQAVVRIRPEIDAAFCSAVRVTLQGSSTPIATMSPYCRWRRCSRSCGLARDAVHHHRGLGARVGDDASQRLLQRASDDPNPASWSRFSPRSASIAPRARSSATPPPGSTPSSIAACVACSASSTRDLRSCHLRLGGRAHLHHGHAAGQLRGPLLQLLAVVVAGGILDRLPDRRDPCVDRGRVARTGR